ncbi:unannotated protein [freshwater metagenome]|uniref:Unannotated protein n=1 Tax=freshwater metagenome TaxID=449393 RepID=A0A6J7MLT8_9ZZZZ
MRGADEPQVTVSTKIDERLGLMHRRGHGLFHEDVLSAFERLAGQGAVLVHAREHQDSIDVTPVNDVAWSAALARLGELGSGGGHAVAVRVVNGRDLNSTLLPQRCEVPPVLLENAAQS